MNGQSEGFRQRTSAQCHRKAITRTHRVTALLMLCSHTKKRLKHARVADNSSWTKLVIKYEQQRTKPNIANLSLVFQRLAFSENRCQSKGHYTI